MGLVSLVVKKSLGFIFLGILIVIFVFILNYDPVMNLVPQNFSSQLYCIRKAINECIPLIVAIFVGIFAQRVVMMYRLYEKAIQEHLKELNEVAKLLFNKISEIGEPAYFTYLSVRGGGYRLYMYIKAPLCDRYREVVRDYEDLVEDIGNHWNKAGKVLNKVDELCKRIDQHNERVKKLEKELEKYLGNCIKKKIVPSLPRVDLYLLRNFIRDLLLREVVPKIVDRRRKFREVNLNDIYKIYKSCSPTVYPGSDGSLRVDGYNVGNITQNDWKKHENLIIEVIYDVLKKYDEQLDELVKEGQNLIKESKAVNEELRECLSIVKDAKILPITTCKYLR